MSGLITLLCIHVHMTVHACVSSCTSGNCSFPALHAAPVEAGQDAHLPALNAYHHYVFELNLLETTAGIGNH